MTATAQEVETRGRRRLALGAWQRSALALFALIMLPFIVFGAEALGRQIFYYHDIQYYFFPYRKLVVDYLRQGWLPLWNPYAFSGIPFLGDGQTAIFYPPNWFFLVLPPTLALNYDVLAQWSLAGAGMFLYTRELSLSRVAALLAAIAFMFNGFMATRVVHLSIISGAALMPFIFWSTDRLRARPSFARLAVAALTVAVQAASGHPQVPVYTAAALGCYVLAQDLFTAGPGKLRRVLRSAALAAAVYMVGYSLIAVQLLPWIDFARLSPRAAGASLEFLAGQSLVGPDWLLLLLPYIYGGVRSGLFMPEPAKIGSAIYVWERAAYVGILPLALAVFALLSIPRRQQPESPRRRPALFGLLAVLLIGLLIAGSGLSPVGRLIYMTPVLGKLRAYARAIILAAFALSALAGFGLQQLIDGTHNRSVPPFIRRRLLLVAGLLALIFAFVLGALPLLLRPIPSNPQRRLLLANLDIARPNAYVPLAFALATVALLLWWARRGAGRYPFIPLLLVGADMIGFAAPFNPTTNAADFQTVPASVAFLQRDDSLYRTATFLGNDMLDPRVARAQLAISWGIAFGIPNINGFNSLQPRRYTDILFGPNVGDVSYGFLGDNALLQPGNNILNLLQVRYVLVQPGVPVKPGRDYEQIFKDATVTIYLNKRVYPRAFFVDQVQATQSQSAAYATLTSRTFDPRRAAIVETGFDPNLLTDPAAKTASAEAAVEQITPNHLRITATTRVRRFLVVSEMFMPGWYATIDGQPAAIYRTDYILRGLVVPAGTHTIEMVYRPLPAIIGVIISTATALLLLAVILWSRRRLAVKTHL